jgi:hypothetical protein
MERIGEPDRSDEFDDVSVEEYAEHRGLEIVSKPRGWIPVKLNASPRQHISASGNACRPFFLPSGRSPYGLEIRSH